MMMLMNYEAHACMPLQQPGRIGPPASQYHTNIYYSAKRAQHIYAARHI